MEPSRSVVGVVGTGRVKMIVVRTTIITVVPAAVLTGEVRKNGLVTRQKAEFRLFQKERFHKSLYRKDLKQLKRIPILLPF